MARILNASQAEMVIKAMAYMNNVNASAEFELRNGQNQKIRVFCGIDNHVRVDLFAAKNCDCKMEIFGTQSQFAFEYGVLDN